MNTPIFDFVNEYSKSGAARFHMPGHKGVNSVLDIENLDITEFDGADNLWNPDGIIAESELNAGTLFNAHTFYSTEGSSLSIRAMMFLVKKWANIRGERPLILAGRNVHKAFINAAAVLDIDVDWIMQKAEDSYQSCSITDKDIDQYMIDFHRTSLGSKKDCKKITPVALYVTSPDYLGNMLDIKALADVCHEHGLLLLVDNAHGAYLKFLDEDLHPITLGADMCCDSAHKTLPALTGAGYLHISKDADIFFKSNAKAALEVFASTSPSYLIMQSLDLCNVYLSSIHAGLSVLTEKVKKIKNQLLSNGYTLIGLEPVKITISAKPYGYTGDEIADILIENNIFTEYHDEDFIVFMLTTKTSDEDIEKLLNALLQIVRREPLKSVEMLVKKPVQAMRFKDALFSDYEIVSGKEALGRILAEPAVSCPPCVPVFMCGEIIDRVYTDRPVKVVKR